MIRFPFTGLVLLACFLVQDLRAQSPEIAGKVVNISGIYPHLAVSNSSPECGIGAVVPWAGKLWVITYGPHLPKGSDDKLYEIAPDLTRITRPESVGGTPANRFIHTATNQLIIGPHFIDAERRVRTLPYTTAPGRYTATTAHLSDPNRLYIFTMENGVYDVDARDLSFVTRYPDVQGKGDNFLSGYHGKGAYMTQGRLIVANNGEPNPTYPSGALATWDGSVRGAANLHPDWMSKWDELFRMQHCEVTGPGDLRGNPNPGSDPAWVSGFDAKSVVLRTLETGQWHTWRLPKGSYTHDGAHGWHTEWPRIRELLPGKWLMHMHGLFFDFPPSFSAQNFAGLKPLCAYEKMPVDYCMFDGRLVIGKNDTSKFDNALVPRAQSNLWFGQLNDLAKWGAPHGHGSVWLNEDVRADTVSEPFLVHGFPRGTLHLRQTGTTDLAIEIQTSEGHDEWAVWKRVTVPAAGYTYELLNDFHAQWIRLRTVSAASGLSASFLLSSRYPHPPPDEFAALADIGDPGSRTEGIIRTVNSPDLPLEFAATKVSADGAVKPGGYLRIGASMELKSTTDAAAEKALRTGASARQDFGSDEASAWVMQGNTKLRLPKFNDAYDAPFASGWARGFRETVTERQMLNCHGTFYEVPRDISGDRRRLKPIATHGKHIADFASWRGLFVATGVLDAAAASEHVVRGAAGEGALWLGEVDDLWRMGEPRGTGGPWFKTAVAAAHPSDPYLMYGYDRKTLRLEHADSATVRVRVEVDILGDDSWASYSTVPVPPGETVTLQFPTGYSAHWVRLVSDTATEATGTFTYGPAAVQK